MTLVEKANIQGRKEGTAEGYKKSRRDELHTKLGCSSTKKRFMVLEVQARSFAMLLREKLCAGETDTG